MKRILITILSVIMLCSVGLFMLTACDGCGEDITQKEPEQVEIYCNLTSHEKQLIVGEETTLIAWTPVVDGTEVVWSTSDSNIVTVTDGKIEAIRPGTATVTATFGEKSDSCTVSVSLGGILPVVEFETAIVNNAVNVAKGSELNLGAYVSFNGKAYTDATVSYEIVGETNDCAIDNVGKFTASRNKGSVTVKVTAEWRGIASPELSKEITVNVISNYIILIDNGTVAMFDLYTVDSHGGKTYKTGDTISLNRITATEDGDDMREQGNLQIEVINQVAGDGSNDDVVSFDQDTKTLTVNKYGTATLKISFTTTDNGTFVKEYPITVTRPVAVNSNNIQMFSALDGLAKVKDPETGIYGEKADTFTALFEKDKGEATVKDAYQNGTDKTGTALTVGTKEDANKIKGLTLSVNDGVSNETVTFYNDKVGYTVTLEAYTKIISKAEDLYVFGTSNANEKAEDIQNPTGYYLVANDISVADTTWTGNYHFRQWQVTGSFGGVFDGNGHTVELILQYGGLFGKLGAGAVVKNVAFIVKQIKGTPMNSASVIAQSTTGSATVKDVYVKYDLGDYELDTSFNGSGYSIGMGVFDDQPYNSTLSNIVIDYSALKIQKENKAFRFGTLYSRPNTATTATWGATSVSNIYVITTESYYCMSYQYGPKPDYATLDEYLGVHFAGNDTEAYNQFKSENPDLEHVYKFDFVKRYSNFSSFAQDKANNDYTAFNPNVWDTTGGFPIFKSLLSEFDLYYIGGSVTDSATISSVNQESVTINASVKGIEYIPTLAITGGNREIVEIQGNVVKAVSGKAGTVQVTATYDINGTTVTKVYSIGVTCERWSGRAIWYSSLDGKMYFDAELEALGIVSVVEASTGNSYYADGEATDNVPKNLDSTKLSNYTNTAIVTLQDGTIYTIDVISYTLVITTAEDLSIFSVNKLGKEDVAPEFTGYYIVVNDISVADTTWKGNIHNSDTDIKGEFKGVFDGNGHTVELNLQYGGLFGLVGANATIKDVAFIVKNIRTNKTNSATILALRSTVETSNDQIVLENVYAEYDVANYVYDTAYNCWGYDLGLGIFAQQPYYSKISNVIINMSKVVTQTEKQTFRYGSLYARNHTSANAEWGTTSGAKINGLYVISTEKSFMTSHEYDNNIASDYAGVSSEYTGVHFAGNDTEAYEQFIAENPGVEKVFKYDWVKRYDSFVAFAQDKTNNDYSSFDTSVWDLTGGFPIFKSLLSEFDFYYIGGSVTDSATISSETQESVTINANVKGIDYIPMLTVTGDDTDIVTIEGNVVKAKPNTAGSVTITATYDINGTIVTKVYNIGVLCAEWQGDPIMYSSLDGKMYFDAELEALGIVSVVEASTDNSYYADGEATDNVPKNLDSTKLSNYTNTAIVTLQDGTIYTIDVISYTKVLTTAQDFAIFNVETDTTLIDGYYILGNDITTKEEVVFTHHGLHEGNAYDNNTKEYTEFYDIVDTTAWNYVLAGFKGTFDGNGHAVTMNVKGSNGIFGQFVDGAVVKNVAFYDMTLGAYSDGKITQTNGELTELSKQHSGYSLLAWQTMNNARNVFITDVFAEITEISQMGTYGGGLMPLPSYTNFTGVLVKFTPEIEGTHGVLNSYNQSQDATRINGLIAITDQRLAGNITNWKANPRPYWYGVGCNEGIEDNATIEGAPEGSYYKVVTNAYRFATFTELANLDAEESGYKANLLANYSADFWDTTNGYPVFKGLEERIAGIVLEEQTKAIELATEFSFGGSTTSTEASLKAGESVDIYATYNGTTYYPTITLSNTTIAEVVTADNVDTGVKATGSGKVTVTATYTIEGYTFVKTYTITCAIESKSGKISHSTLDGKFYMPEALHDDQDNVKTIASTTDTTNVYYINGEFTSDAPANADSSDLTNYTNNVLVTLKDGSKYTIDMVTYTMVITKAEDLSKLGDTTDSTDVTTDGYYIVANDISVADTTWAGNSHYRSWDIKGIFAGTFDGNGHTVELILKHGGLFGKVGSGAVIKDVAFVVKQLKETGVNSATVIASTSTASWSNMTKLQNIYVKYDLPESTVINATQNSSGSDVGIGLFNRQPINSDWSNVVVDMGSVKTTATGTDMFRYGALYSRPYDADTTTGASLNNTLSNVYVISSESFISMSHTYSGTDILDAYTQVHFAGNDTEAFEQFKTENPDATVYSFSNVKRYSNYTAMANANNDYSSFDSNVWDTKTYGVPVFKSCKDKVAPEIITASAEYEIGGHQGLNAEVLAGQSEAQTVSIYANYGTNKYSGALTIVSEGADWLSVEGNTVTVNANAEAGKTAQVKAVFTIMVGTNSYNIEKTFTVTITDDAAKKLNGSVMYSANDTEFKFSVNDYKDLTVSKVTSTDGNTTYYDASSEDNMLNMLTLGEKTTVILTFSDNTSGEIELTPYTQVITEAEHLKLLINDSATADTNVDGYYILANDIDVANTSDYTPANNSNNKSIFIGTLDGNEHTIKNLVVGTNGLLGKLGENGCIKNLVITVTTTATTKLTAKGLIANGIISKMENGKFTIDNCYFDIDAVWNVDNSSNIGAIFGISPNKNISMKNCIIDLADGLVSAPTNSVATTYGIVFYGVTNNLMGAENGTYLGTSDGKMELFTNCYYINSDYMYLALKTVKDKTTGTALVCENDTAMTTDCITTVGKASGINRYESLDKLPTEASNIIRPTNG